MRVYYWCIFLMSMFDIYFYQTMKTYCLPTASVLAIFHCLIYCRYRSQESLSYILITLTFVVYAISDVIFLLANYLYPKLVYVYVPCYLVGHLLSDSSILSRQISLGINPIKNHWLFRLSVLLPYCLVGPSVIYLIF